MAMAYRKSPMSLWLVLASALYGCVMDYGMEQKAPDPEESETVTVCGESDVSSYGGMTPDQGSHYRFACETFIETAILGDFDDFADWFHTDDGWDLEAPIIDIFAYGYGQPPPMRVQVCTQPDPIVSGSSWDSTEDVATLCTADAYTSLMVGDRTDPIWQASFSPASPAVNFDDWEYPIFGMHHGFYLRIEDPTYETADMDINAVRLEAFHYCEGYGTLRNTDDRAPPVVCVMANVSSTDRESERRREDRDTRSPPDSALAYVPGGSRIAGTAPDITRNYSEPESLLDMLQDAATSSYRCISGSGRLLIADRAVFRSLGAARRVALQLSGAGRLGTGAQILSVRAAPTIAVLANGDGLLTTLLAEAVRLKSIHVADAIWECPSASAAVTHSFRELQNAFLKPESKLIREFALADVGCAIDWPERFSVNTLTSTASSLVTVALADGPALLRIGRMPGQSYLYRDLFVSGRGSLVDRPGYTIIRSEGVRVGGFQLCSPGNFLLRVE